MAVLFRRQIVVQVAGLTITEPRINLEVEREIDETQATGRIDVYNLAPQHEQRIYEREGPVVVSAGYPETLATIFEGQAQKITRAREKLAFITRIKVGDQVRKAGRIGGIFTRSYEGAVPIRQIATDIAESMGLPLGPLDNIPAGATFDNFYWSGASASSAMTVLLRRVDCRWFESDGVIRINKTGTVQSDAPPITVSPSTGLVGTPVATDEGAEVTLFLNPAVVLGCKMTIEDTLTLAGDYKVVSMRHTADNWEGNFQTFCELRPLDDVAPGPQVSEFVYPGSGSRTTAAPPQAPAEAEPTPEAGRPNRKPWCQTVYPQSELRIRGSGFSLHGKPRITTAARYWTTAWNGGTSRAASTALPR